MHIYNRSEEFYDVIITSMSAITQSNSHIQSINQPHITQSSN